MDNGIEMNTLREPLIAASPPFSSTEPETANPPPAASHDAENSTPTLLHSPSSPPLPSPFHPPSLTSLAPPGDISEPPPDEPHHFSSLDAFVATQCDAEPSPSPPTAASGAYVEDEQGGVTWRIRRSCAWEETNPTKVWTKSDFRALLAELKRLGEEQDRGEGESEGEGVDGDERMGEGEGVGVDEDLNEEWDQDAEVVRDEDMHEECDASPARSESSPVGQGICTPPPAEQSTKSYLRVGALRKNPFDVDMELGDFDDPFIDQCASELPTTSPYASSSFRANSFASEPINSNSYASETQRSSPYDSIRPAPNPRNRTTIRTNPFTGTIHTSHFPPSPPYAPPPPQKLCLHMRRSESPEPQEESVPSYLPAQPVQCRLRIRVRKCQELTNESARILPAKQRPRIRIQVFEEPEPIGEPDISVSGETEESTQNPVTRRTNVTCASFPRSYGTVRREVISAFWAAPREVRQATGYETIRWIGKKE